MIISQFMLAPPSPNNIPVFLYIRQTGVYMAYSFFILTSMTSVNGKSCKLDAFDISLCNIFTGNGEGYCF